MTDKADDVKEAFPSEDEWAAQTEDERFQFLKRHYASLSARPAREAEDKVRSGKSDSNPVVQAFARHREEAEKRIVDWLRGSWGMLPEALDFADFIEAGDHHAGEQ